MQITKIKRSSKIKDGEEVKTVDISYVDGNKEVLFHGYAEPDPEFHKLFDELSKHVCEICEFSDHEIGRNRVTGVSISYTETEDTDDVQNIVFTVRRKLVASPQPLIYNTPLKHSEHNDPGQKLSADCFATVEALSAEAEEYIGGKKQQIDAFQEADKKK
jgi:hypothetical protein